MIFPIRHCEPSFSLVGPPYARIQVCVTTFPNAAEPDIAFICKRETMENLADTNL
jgi:hypothetical protein